MTIMVPKSRTGSTEAQISAEAADIGEDRPDNWSGES